MLASFKRMSYNTSPGNDGFTVEFFKQKMDRFVSYSSLVLSVCIA